MQRQTQQRKCKQYGSALISSELSVTPTGVHSGFVMLYDMPSTGNVWWPRGGMGHNVSCHFDIFKIYQECILNSGMKHLIQYLRICVMIAVEEQPLRVMY